MGPMWYFGDGNRSLETSVVGKNVDVATVFRKPDADVTSTLASWNLIKIARQNSKKCTYIISNLANKYEDGLKSNLLLQSTPLNLLPMQYSLTVHFSSL